MQTSHPNVPGTGSQPITPNIPGLQSGTNVTPSAVGGLNDQHGAYDPAKIFVNTILMPCAQAVANRLPTLTAQGREITPNLILEDCFLAEFNQLQSVRSYVQGIPMSSSTPSSVGGIRPPSRSSPVAPGYQSNVILKQVPGIRGLHFPDPDKMGKCWWRNTRNRENKNQQCSGNVGSNGIYCEKCMKKKTAGKRVQEALNLKGDRNLSLRDYLLSLMAGDGNINNVPGTIPGTTTTSHVPPAPENTEENQVTVSYYPTPESLDTGLVVDGSNIVYVLIDDDNIAIGSDSGDNSGTILPLSNQQKQYLNELGARIDDRLAQQFAAHGGLPASRLNNRGQLIASNDHETPASTNAAVTTTQSNTTTHVQTTQAQPVVNSVQPQMHPVQPQVTQPQMHPVQPQVTQPQMHPVQPQVTQPQVTQPQVTQSQMHPVQPAMVPIGIPKQAQPIKSPVSIQQPQSTQSQMNGNHGQHLPQVLANGQTN